MKNIFHLKQLFIIIYLFVVLAGCTKYAPPVQPALDVNYSVDINGFSVKFTNQTNGGVSYKWDFGDGQTSTEESPTHVYPGKGKYVPTLYVTAKSGAIVEGSTVLRLSKTSPIKLNDNSLSDWDTVSVYSYVFTGAGNAAQKAKFDYDATSLYFYFEVARTLADDDVYDFYLDTDNSLSGYDVSYAFTGEGADVVIEGQILDPNPWANLMYYVGPGWNWSTQSVSGFYQIGTVVQTNGLLKFEGKIDRTKVKGLTGTAVKLGVIINTSNWSAQVGYIPDLKTPAIAIDMSE